MFIPADVAQTEPLLDMDSDLAEMEQQAAAAPTVDLLINMATEYYSRAYLQRALYTADQLTLLDPGNPAGWKLLANSQLDVGQDAQASLSLKQLMAIPGLDITDQAWAEAMMAELNKKNVDIFAVDDPPQQPAPTPQPPAPQSPPAPAPAQPQAAPSLSETFGAAAPIPVPQPVANQVPSAVNIMGDDDPSLVNDPLSALSLAPAVDATPSAPVPKPPPSPKAPMENSVGGVLEQQGIITQIATKDSGQLDSVRLLLEKDPNNVELLDWYAFALYSCERIEEAIEVYERIINDFEKTDNALYYLGSAYLKIPNLKKAFEYFNMLKESFPNSHLNKKVADKKNKLKALTK